MKIFMLLALLLASCSKPTEQEMTKAINACKYYSRVMKKFTIDAEFGESIETAFYTIHYISHGLMQEFLKESAKQVWSNNFDGTDWMTECRKTHIKQQRKEKSNNV